MCFCCCRFGKKKKKKISSPKEYYNNFKTREYSRCDAAVMLYNINVCVSKCIKHIIYYIL